VVDGHAVGNEIGRVSARRQEERAQNQRQHRGDFADAEDVLYHTAEPDAEVVDNGQHGDEQRGDAFDADLLQRRDVANPPYVNSEAGERTRQLRQLHKFSRVFREHVSHRGDRSRLENGERGPAVKVGEEWSIHAFEKDILPAGFGDHGRDLGIGQRAEQRENSSQQPHSEQQFG
jgi:hypothetical protein